MFVSSGKTPVFTIKININLLLEHDRGLKGSHILMPIASYPSIEYFQGILHVILIVKDHGSHSDAREWTTNANIDKYF